MVGIVLPDSSPLLSLVSLLGASVAMGNAVVMVPSQKYPLPALEFIQVCLSVGIEFRHVCVCVSECKLPYFTLSFRFFIPPTFQEA